MSHFSFDAELADALRMDGPMRGPAMRWQKKQTSVDNVSMNASTNSAKITPMKSANRSATAKTPSKNSGKKTPGKGCKTPSGDRFIPNRSTTQFDLSQYQVTQENQRKAGCGDEDEEMLSPSKLEYQKIMSENLNGADLQKKILSFKTKAPSAPEGYGNSLQVLYSSSCKSQASLGKKSMRNIPAVPERILDAPEMLDDYYLNLLDWSQTNLLAVALSNSVYLWNATTGDITQLLSLEAPEDCVGSVSFLKEGNLLAVGSTNGEVQLWDVNEKKKLRTMSGHLARVGSLSWNSYILSSGSRSGHIHHHDVRVAQHHISTLTGHTQEVCGLRWSLDGRYLASGGNDNLLNIWSGRSTQSGTDGSCQPQYQFSQHQAAVKALAWCPWLPNVLASGGGTADRHIRFWNCNTGTCLDAVDTKSQVCALLWSQEYKELISSHGFALNQLTIWKYPGMTKVAELTGHTARVLHMVMSPDGSTVMSAGADETLRLWKCFAVDTEKKKAQKAAASKTKTSQMSRLTIR